MANFGEMKLGIMSLGLNQRVTIRVFFYLSYGMVTMGLSVAHAAYPLAELRAVETADEAKVRQLREQEVTQLRIALGRRAGSNRLATLYFRLAEIYLEAYHATFLLEGKVHEHHLGLGASEEKIDRESSHSFLQLGIKACLEVLSFKIDYDRMDQIYYFLGFNYAELEDDKQSERYYHYLVEHFPESVFSGFAYKELGLSEFRRKQFRSAINYLEKAQNKMSQTQDVKHRPSVLHKLSWAYYRVSQYEKAVAFMQEAVQLCRAQGTYLKPIQDEALRDLTVMMAVQADASVSIDYFKTESPTSQDRLKLLELLGKEYARNVALDKAILVYQAMRELAFRESGQDDLLLRITLKLVEFALNRNDFTSVKEQLQVQKKWATQNQETQALILSVKNLIRKTAIVYHQNYRKNKNINELKISEILYSVYIDSFLKMSDVHQEMSEIKMYLAEVKKELGQSKEAVELYRDVVNSKDLKYAKDASQMWLSSLVSALKKTSSSNQAPSQRKKEPSDLEKEFVIAADQMASNQVTPESLEVAFRAAQVQAGYPFTYEDAIRRCRLLIKQWPDSNQAHMAAQLWLQVLSDNWIHPTSLKDISLFFKGMESMEFAVQELQSNLILMATDRTRYRSELGEIFKKRTIEPLQRAATFSLISGRFHKAAQFFKKLGVATSDSDSLDLAARLEIGVGEEVEAQQILRKAIDLFPKSTQQGRWQLLLALSYEREKSFSEAKKAYQFCAVASQDWHSECYARLGDFYDRSGDREKAKSYYTLAIREKTSLKKKNQVLSPFYSMALFELARFQENSWNYEPLNFPEVELQKSVKQRLALFEKANQIYQPIVQLGGPWAISALHRLAEMANSFANELDAVTPPSDIGEVGLVRFKKSVDHLVQTLREKAKGIWAQAYQQATDSVLYSPILPQVVQSLKFLKTHASLNASDLILDRKIDRLTEGFHISGFIVDHDKKNNDSLTDIQDKLLNDIKNDKIWIEYGNALFSDSQYQLAQVIYQYAFHLNSINANTLNNLGIVLLNIHQPMGWIDVFESDRYFQESSKKDKFLIEPVLNRALLFNQYQLFKKSQPMISRLLSSERNHLTAPMKRIAEEAWIYAKEKEIE